MTVQTNPLLEAFNAGEFSGRMAARVQFDKYQNAGSEYQNVIPLPQGGYASRPGFRYIAGAKSNSVRPWLLPFIYSTDQAYCLELGNNCLRFYKDQAQITALDISSTIANGTFGSDISSWTARNTGSGAIAHDSTNDDMNLNGGGSGNEARAYQSVTTSNTGTEHVLAFEIVGDPGDEITVRIGSSAGGSQYYSDAKRLTGVHTIEFTPGASPYYVEFENGQSKTISIDNVSILDNVAVELVTPWPEATLPDISYAQSADVIYFAAGGSYPVYRLERYGHSSWSLIKVLFSDGPWLTENSESTTLTPGATSGNGVTITASAVTGINDDTGFRTADVGRLIRIKDAANNWTWMQIVGYTSTTQVSVDIKGPNLSSTAARSTWRLGEWNDTDGWPSVVSFIQQRFATARTTKEPQKFWLSKSADIQNFADSDTEGAVVDDSSINYKFASREVNTIRWIASRKKPIIGTQGGNWTLNSDGAVLTPTDISAVFEVSGGVAPIPPLEIRSRLVFAQAQSRKLVEFADVIQDNGLQGYDSFDLTILNDRVLKDGLVQLAYQQQPDSTIWGVRGDGQMPTLTYQPEQNVIGWARHILGGSFHGGDAIVESVTTIPGQDGSGQFKDSSGRHEIWVAVKREVNGSTVRYIECLEKLYNGDEDLQEEAFYVDSGLTLDQPKTITAATRAKPVQITAANHGFSDGDLVRIVRVKGMSELNANTYKIAEVTTNTFELGAIDGVSVTAVTKANPGSVSAPNHGLVTGNEVHFHDIGGMTDLNGNGYTVTKVDDNTFTIGVNSTGFGTFTSGGRVYLATDGSAYTTYSADGEARKKVTSVTGLTHLEGQSVKVYADGAVQTDKTVSSGAITLDNAASMVHVGLSYERRWKSLKLAYGGQGGTAVGQPKNIADVILILLEAAEGSLSMATVDIDGEGSFTELDLRSAVNLDDAPVPFFTGEKALGITAGHDTDIRLLLKGTSPVPFTVLGLSPEMEVA